MSVLERAVVLPRQGFLTAWSMIDLPDPHPIIGTDRHLWTDDESTRALHEETLTLLVEKGLARGGRLNPLWINTLTLMAAPAREFYAFSQYRDDSHGAVLVAANDTDALRVIADPQAVIIEPIPATRLATALFDSLPPIDPAAGVRAVSMTRAEAENGPTHPDDPLAEAPDTRDYDELVSVLGAPRDAAHQLYAACRRDGERVRSSPITALDLTGRGRVLTYATGDDEIVMHPATFRDSILALNDTLDGLR